MEVKRHELLQIYHDCFLLWLEAQIFTYFGHLYGLVCTYVWCSCVTELKVTGITAAYIISKFNSNASYWICTTKINCSTPSNNAAVWYYIKSFMFDFWSKTNSTPGLQFGSYVPILLKICKFHKIFQLKSTFTQKDTDF